MSVIFFDVEELGNVALVLSNPWARSVDDFNLEALARYSQANARAFNVRYGTPRKDIAAETGYTAKQIRAAMQAPRKPDLLRACSTARLMAYNTVEADPTKEEMEATSAIVAAVLSKATDALELAAGGRLVCNNSGIWGKR